MKFYLPASLQRHVLNLTGGNLTGGTVSSCIEQCNRFIFCNLSCISCQLL